MKQNFDADKFISDSLKLLLSKNNSPPLIFSQPIPASEIKQYTAKTKMSRKFVIGDIHGRKSALQSVLSQVNFDYDFDTLYCLGDICDGGEDTKGCVDILLTVKNLVLIKGNHDEWFVEYLKTGNIEPIWFNQGGKATLDSYHGIETCKKMYYTHKNFWIQRKKEMYEMLSINRRRHIFVHAGFPKTEYGIRFINQGSELFWDRTMVEDAKNGGIIKLNYGYADSSKPKKIFVGHTTTQKIMQDVDATKPLFFQNVVCLDTGAGWNGKLTIMNVETLEYWQSELQEPYLGKS